MVDVAPHYGLLSVQGPKASEVVKALDLEASVLPTEPMTFVSRKDATLGEVYLMNLPRTATSGFDWFVPTAALGTVADRLITAAKRVGGRACGWRAPSRGSECSSTSTPSP